MNKALIFDVDGTLWDAVSVITDSWNLTASRYPEITTTISPSEMSKYMGQPMSAFVKLFPTIDERKALEVLDKCCKEEIDYLYDHPGRLYDGMKETIIRLSKDYDLYIVSNCQEGYIEALLHTTGLESYFKDFENFGRTGKLKDENIRILMERCDIKKAIYIGDTATDMDSAFKNDLPFIYAAYGMGEVDNARYLINSPSELPEVIKSTRYYEL
ncbi:MAG: HAD family hydrolase [Lachnospiraceae bacterium]|nr:HAD family hydrolase [Lachnospiraceae bacterium]